MKTVLAILLLTSLAAPAWAQDVDPGTVSRITHEVSMEVYSPFCPGKTLAMCPSPNAADVRMDIQKMATEGMEKEAIKDEVVKKYGEEFRLQPPPASDNYGLFALILLTFIGVFGIVKFISRKPSDGAPQPDPTIHEEDDYLDELREEVRS